MQPTIPKAPNTIQKGTPLKEMLGSESVGYLANNILMVFPSFDASGFKSTALTGIDPLTLHERGLHIATALRQYLPNKYEHAIEIIINSLTPPSSSTEVPSLGFLFYHPHSFFISQYGVDAAHNEGEDPFDISMNAIYELTKRSTSEFCIRPFIIKHQDRTLKRIEEWVLDPNPHVRRLCSEGTRPRLPWATRIPSFIDNPLPVLPILESLKNDESLYVRRSVANHLGDIAKDHLELVFDICQKWLPDASKELKWVIRHALRYPAKKGNAKAIKIRQTAK